MVADSSPPTSAPPSRARRQRAPRGIPPAPAFRYDAFISFSPEDAAWVEGWLLPRLEQAGLTVCTPETCFEPGAPLAAETERAIRESRRILAVLSPAWVEGDWAAFEAQIVHFQDPNAHTRRLIPLLLTPCEPPERIRLLSWVDLTDEAEREEQLARVVQAIRGERALPELRPDRFPEPQVWLSQTFWFKLVGVAAVLTLGLVAAGLAWPRLPPSVKCALTPNPRMPDSENSYNIAVAAFTPDEEDPGAGDGRTGDRSTGDGADGDADQGAARARDVVHLVQSLAPGQGAIVHKPVTVWGPDECVAALAANEASAIARLAALDANVLVYGNLRHLRGTGW